MKLANYKRVFLVLAMAYEKSIGLLLLVPMLGCVISTEGKDNVHHHLVIGFGIVSTNESKDSALIATDVSALGITIMDRPGLKFGVGYTSSTVVTIGPCAKDVRAEISKHFTGPFIVNAPSTVLGQKEDCSDTK